MEQEYNSTSQFEVRGSDRRQRPTEARGGLSLEHQARIAKSANKLLDQLSPNSPLRDFRVSSPSRSFERGGERPVSSPGFKH